MVEDWRKVTPYFLGDYYPLSDYSLDPTAWVVWQFDRPDLGEGMVQTFCRAGTIYEAARVHLRGLEAGADYTLTDLDTGRTRRAGGKGLMEAGLVITSSVRPSAPVILYKKVR